MSMFGRVLVSAAKGVSVVPRRTFINSEAVKKFAFNASAFNQEHKLVEFIQATQLVCFKISESKPIINTTYICRSQAKAVVSV